MKKINWQLVLDKSWFYTKILFGLILLSCIAYGAGTFNPNKSAKKQANIELEQFYIKKIKDMELREPEFTYNNDVQFVRAMHKCIDYHNFSLPRFERIPYEMIIAQAALESGWGTSRFANEGNNLFGIRTWTKTVPHMIPHGIKKWPGWGVKIFGSKCDSVKEYIRILNNHPEYEEFRTARQNFFVQNMDPDPLVLIKKIGKFSTTSDYDKRVERIILKIRELEGTYATDKELNK